MSQLHSLAARAPPPRAPRGRLVRKGPGLTSSASACRASRSPARAAAQARLGVRASRTASDSWVGTAAPWDHAFPWGPGTPHPGSKAQDVRPPPVSILTSCVTRACYPPSETRFLVCLQGHRGTAITRHRLGGHRKQCQAPPERTLSPRHRECGRLPRSAPRRQRAGVPSRAPSRLGPRPRPGLTTQLAPATCTQVIKAGRSHLNNRPHALAPHVTITSPR